MTQAGKRVLFGAGVPLVVLLIFGAVWAFLFTPPGAHWLASRLGGWLSTPDRAIVISGLELRWPLNLRIKRIDLSDRPASGMAPEDILWMTLEDSAVDWRPERLFTGELWVDSVIVGNARMLRRPPPSGGSPTVSGFRLPLALRVDHAALQLSVSPDVTGQALDLLAEGHARVSSGRSDIDFTLRRPDNEATEAHARVGYDRPSATLALDLGVSEPISRLLVRLAHLEDSVPALDMRLSGDGALSDWRGTMSGTKGAKTCLDGTLRLARTSEWNVGVDAGLAPECLPDPKIAQLLRGAPVAVRANMAVAQGRLTRIAEAHLRSAAFSAGLSGTLEGRLGIRFSLETRELDRFGTLADLSAAGGLQATGTVTGSLDRPVVEAHLASSSGRLQNAEWKDLAADLQVNPAGGEGWMAGTTGSAIATGTPLSQDDKALSWSGTIHYRPADGIYRLAELRLDGLGGQASMFGTFSPGGAVALRGQARGRLAAFADLLGLPGLEGRAIAWLSVSGKAASGVSARLWGQVNGLETGANRLGQLLGATPGFAAAANYRAGAVPMVWGRVAGRDIRARLQGRAAPGLEIGWQADLPRLAALPALGLDGAVAARGLVLGTVAAPQLTGLVEGTVAYRGVDYEMRAAVGATNPREPSGALHVGLRNSRLTAELASRFQLSQGLRLSDLILFSRQTRFTGDLAVANGGVAGHLSGHSADLAPWSDLAGTALDGSLTVDASLRHDDGRQGIEATFTGDGLGVAKTRIGHLTGRAAVQDALGAPKVAAHLQGTTVRAAGTNLHSLDVRAEGTAAALTFDLRGDGGDQPGGLGISSRGSFSYQGDAQTLHLAALSLQGGGVTGRLTAPTTLTRRGDAVTIPPTRLDIGGGRIELAGSINGPALDLRLSLANTPAELVSAYLPSDTKAVGSVTATALLTGTTEAPVLTLDGSGKGLGLAGAGRERLNLSLHGRWRDRVLEVNADASGNRGTTATLAARLPLLPDFSVPDGGAINGRLRGNGDLGRLTAALPLPGHRFAGKLAADIAVAGTVGQPSVSGEATLRDGYYEYYDTGTRIRAIQATLTARDSRTFAITLAGSDDRGRGRITGDGHIRAQGLVPSWDLSVALNDFPLIDQDAARARASGQLAFTGQGGNGRLAGRISVGPGEYNFTEGLFGGGVPKLTNVVEINRPGNRPAVRVTRAAPKVTQDEPEMVFPVDITLAVDADVDRLFVRGRGLESDWRGHLSIGGTARHPSISGQLEAVHGAYDFVGKRFQITEGRVTFEGGGKIDPDLDVTAEASANDITAQVKVGGTAGKPRVEFTSVPALPSDEVLSRLLFGRSIGQLSVAQQVQIARAAASLTGKGQFDPIGNLKNQLGLDLLDVGVSDESGSSLSPNVTVGKYLDRDTFLRLEEGLGSSEGKAAIERRLGHGLSVEADVGQRGTGGVGLSWRKDY